VVVVLLIVVEESRRAQPNRKPQVGWGLAHFQSAKEPVTMSCRGGVCRSGGSFSITFPLCGRVF